MPAAVDPSDYLTAPEIGELLDVHPQSVQTYFREGGLPGRKVGGTWTTTRAAFDQWLTSGNTPPDADTEPGALPPLETK